MVFRQSDEKKLETKNKSFQRIELNTNLKHGFLFKASDEWIVPCKNGKR